MKRFFLLVLIFVLFTSGFILSSGGDTDCQQATASGLQYALTGGRYKPSANATGQFMRALIVFVQFDDDNTPVTNWTKGSMPTWANDLIDNTASSSYRNLTISDYFKDMSKCNFDFIGDVYPNLISLPTTKAYGSANRDVIGILNTNIADFTRYDKWSFNGTNFVFSGDGYLDMLIIIYRYANPSPTFFGLTGGIAWLNIGTEYTTHDGVKINGGLSVQGSGITTNTRGLTTNAFGMTTHLAHEYGHYLFGSVEHIRTGGLMSGYPYDYHGDTKTMSAWERKRLGYITPYLASTDGYTRTIGDYVDTGDAIKVTIPYNDSLSTEYLMIENHQRVSPYDQVIRGGAIGGALDPNCQIGKGVYVWYIRNGNSYPPNIYAITADGLWNWAFDSWITMPDGWQSPLALIKRNGINRNMNSGLSDRDPFILSYSGSWHRWHDYNLVTNQWELTREVMGDEQDAFNIGYNQYITPWSNPSTTKTGGATNISIELNSQNGNNVTMKCYSTSSSAQNLPPSRPQNLKLSSNPGNGRVKLTWETNIEPDISLYEISRKAGTEDVPGSWAVIATTANSFYVDNQYQYSQGSIFNVNYKIRAKDTQNFFSTYSDITACKPWPIGKESVNNKEITNAVLENNLSAYPNPFNPTTNITFILEKDAFVKLKVYDILGREVCNLLDEYKERGSYSYQFNGNLLSSGIYLAMLEINNELYTKKIILNK